MRRDISGNNSITGANMMLVLFALLLLVGICVADFTIRWVQWCNISNQPYANAVKNISLLLIASTFITLSATEYVRSKNIWQVVVWFAVFFCTIPTAVFFSPYLIANALLAISVFCISRVKNTNISRVNIFFASFLIGLAMLWVPSVILYMVVVFVAVMLFCPQDIRSWIMPFMGLLAVAVVITTYRMFFLDEINILENVTWNTFFAMPYTEKVFKSYNFYFYVSIIGTVCFVAYMKYIKMAGNDTLPEKKQSILLTFMLLSSVAIAVLSPESRYMIVFASLPFTLIMSKYYTQYASRTWGTIISWVLVVMAIVSLLLFK